MSTKKVRCRHRNSWLLAGGYVEWCYECGAIRQMERRDETNSIFVREGKDGRRAQFIKPVGQGGENPSHKLVD